jgi:hypothetical protein
MPIYRIPRHRLDEDIVSIERRGERVVQVTLDPDNMSRWLVVTQWIGVEVEVETR